MRFLILGGTRFLGPALVEAAVARGHEVTLFNRGRTDPGLFPQIELLRGDRESSLEALGEDREWEAVFDTWAYLPRQVRTVAEVLRDRIDQYLFVSSLAVYARAEPELDEEAELAQLDPSTRSRLDKLTSRDINRLTYGPLKAECESVLKEEFEGSITVVRPGLLAGPRDPSGRFHYWPWRLDVGGEILAPGPRGGRLQFIDVRDLAEWMIVLAEERRLGTFNAVGPAGELTFEELLYACRAVTVSPGRLVWLERDFLVSRGFRTWYPLPLWTDFEDPLYAATNAVSRARSIDHGLAYRPLADTCRAVLRDIRSASTELPWSEPEVIARDERLIQLWREG